MDRTRLCASINIEIQMLMHYREHVIQFNKRKEQLKRNNNTWNTSMVVTTKISTDFGYA